MVPSPLPPFLKGFQEKVIGLLVNLDRKMDALAHTQSNNSLVFLVRMRTIEEFDENEEKLKDDIKKDQMVGCLV